MKRIAKHHSKIEWNRVQKHSVQCSEGKYNTVQLQCSDVFPISFLWLYRAIYPISSPHLSASNQSNLNKRDNNHQRNCQANLWMNISDWTRSCRLAGTWQDGGNIHIKYFRLSGTSYFLHTQNNKYKNNNYLTNENFYNTKHSQLLERIILKFYSSSMKVLTMYIS